MINFVTKRDGSVEPFSADKLQRWIEITAKEDVNWSELAFRAYRKLNDYCSSQDLHKALVSACLDIGTEASLRVAGKVLISGVYKDLYDGIDNIPTLKELASKYWVELDYTDKEWKELNKELNHSKDLSYNYTSIRQMMDKYLIKNRVTGEIKETPQFMFMGIAMSALEDETDNRIDKVKKLYHFLSDMKLNLPSPMLTNLRTPLKGYASCCVFNVGDTVESIGVGEHIAYTMTAKSAGIGGILSTRSRGDSVKNGTVLHLGKIPLYRQIESAVAAMMQVGRGGNATIHFTVLDPEVKDLIQLKNPMTLDEKKVRGMDYSVVYNSVFAKAVAQNRDWVLISQQLAPDLYESLFSSDVSLFEQLLNKYLKDVKDGVVKGEIVKAREIALDFLTQSLETGRIYLFNAEEVNKHTPFKDTIYSSNLCQLAA